MECEEMKYALDFPPSCSTELEARDTSWISFFMRPPVVRAGKAYVYHPAGRARGTAATVASLAPRWEPVLQTKYRC